MYNGYMGAAVVVFRLPSPPWCYQKLGVRHGARVLSRYFYDRCFFLFFLYMKQITIAVRVWVVVVVAVVVVVIFFFCLAKKKIGAIFTATNPSNSQSTCVRYV